MPNRIYLIIALAFLVGGPVLVSMISGSLPTNQAAEVAPEAAPIPPAAQPPEEPPMLPQAIEQAPGTTQPLFDAAPTMSAEPLALDVSSDQQPPTFTSPPQPVEPVEIAPPPPVVRTKRDPSLLPPDIPASQHR